MKIQYLEDCCSTAYLHDVYRSEITCRTKQELNDWLIDNTKKSIKKIIYLSNFSFGNILKLIFKYNFRLKGYYLGFNYHLVWILVKKVRKIES